MNKIVVYTAIFGNKDELLRPKAVPPGCDFVCFTDDANLKAIGPWQVRTVEPELADPVRNARRRKILAHEYLPEYEISVWVDGNVIVRGDVNEPVHKYLIDANMAVFDHAENAWDPRSSVVAEAEALIKMAEDGRAKDDPELIREQMDRYRREGYPDRNGLIMSSAMLRRHNAPDVVKAMEAWWKELERGSRRDQLSFNYAAWKTGLKFNWLPGDSRDNPYFKHTFHPEHRPTLWRRVKRRLKKIWM